MASKFCAECGNSLEAETHFCTKCGKKIEAHSPSTESTSQKSAVTALLLCLFLGAFGAHRFYVGKIGTGILMLITGGGFGIWILVDLILIARCEFKDKNGRPLIFTRGRGSSTKLILTIIGSMIAAIIVYVILLSTLVLYATSGLTETIDNQLAALRSGNIEKAYSYTSKDFQDNTSLADFKTFVAHYPAFKNNQSASFSEKEFKNNEGIVIGTLKSNEGTTTQVKYLLIKEEGSWKILGITISPTAGIKTNHQTMNTATDEHANFNTYEDQTNKFTIKYPKTWVYEQPNDQTVIFSGKKGTSSYYSTIVIEVVPNKKGKGIYENPKEAIEDLKNQINKQATHVTITDGGPVELPQNPEAFRGESFITSYSYKGRSMKKLQFIISKKDGLVLYSWSFTSPKEQYSKDLPVAKAMYESWMIK